ncbi:tRNA guanosine-2'-O-methyltransferase TRM13 like protein [Habropoda laboriosa]|uniref:tRNA:m(4)X modification enzyme TRM13 n=1 Tax=Habropoda laboriosa TaxID=597456 RepID=A0A0L7R8E7_9HYME|nr:PREDICTED: tRNA:m(4)X modification enzyme TRM13 homolog [Habropoda laboriosa]KOC67036.1 tRNA guanosine-2'-O-methyltransferase TRM13 like protein [Habropoda laboriosa]
MTEENHCMYFVKRKKRYCRMTVRKGNRYCGEHQEVPLESFSYNKEASENKRIKCPLDPTHTCYESKLAKHLKVCNAKRFIDAQPSFIVKGINVKEVCDAPRHVPLSELSELVISTVIDKVKTAYEKLPKFPKILLQHEVLKDKIHDNSCGKSIKKHLSQNSSLLSHLELANLVKENTCFIEFGAGKGKLTYWLGQIIKDKKNCGILLIDRSSHRHKSDNKLKSEQFLLVIERVRVDIADLKLNNMTVIQKFEHKVAIAKHLCGAATDLTLNCLIQAMQNEPKCNISGLVIAFCCHHKCDYASYVGKQFLKQCGFTSNEFTVLCSIASWATCGSGLNESKKILNTQNNSNDTRINIKNLTSSEREKIGRKVKLLLNWGRLEYLKNVGFQSNLVYYTTTDISLENMCIVATKS